MKPIVLIAVLSFYSGHTLQWEDFKGSVPTGATYAAMTAYEWVMDISTESDGSVSATVKWNFLPNRSWVRVKDSSVLVHENYHLRIAEVYCNQLSKAFKSISGCKNCEEIVNSMYKKSWDAMEAEQNLYDEQTNHSTNKPAQLAWEDKINKLK
jgi:hypothetical protein